MIKPLISTLPLQTAFLLGSNLSRSSFTSEKGFVDPVLSFVGSDFTRYLDGAYLFYLSSLGVPILPSLRVSSHPTISLHLSAHNLHQSSLGDRPFRPFLSLEIVI